MSSLQKQIIESGIFTVICSQSSVYNKILLNMWMFIAALFCKLKTTQMSVNRGMDKLKTILTMEYYSDMKRNEPRIYTTAWMYLTDLLSETGKHKSICCMIPCM